MSDAFSTSPARKKPNDPRARERLREAQAVEARAAATVYAAEAKVATAITRRDNTQAIAKGWVAGATELLDRARADLVSISGVDRAALLLGISKSELRRSLSAANAQDGAE